MIGYCSVVDGECVAPAGIGTTSGYGACEPGRVHRCQECYELVCKQCSKMATIRGKRAKYCHNCIAREFGEDQLRNRYMLHK